MRQNIFVERVSSQVVPKQMFSYKIKF